jgi:hypothetical protein
VDCGFFVSFLARMWRSGHVLFNTLDGLRRSFENPMWEAASQFVDGFCLGSKSAKLLASDYESSGTISSLLSATSEFLFSPSLINLCVRAKFHSKSISKFVASLPDKVLWCEQPYSVPYLLKTPLIPKWTEHLQGVLKICWLK